MANTSEIRNGLCINHNNDVYTVVEFLHVKPGKGPAFVRTKLKSLTNGKVIDNTWPSSHKIDIVRVERRKFQYLYNDSEGYHCMDMESYEQLELQKEFVGERAAFLQDGMEVTVESHEGRPIGIQLPDQVTLEVTDTEPHIKGQTVSSSYKPATLENGVKTGVPPFVVVGDKIVVDTNEITYVKRAE